MQDTAQEDHPQIPEVDPRVARIQALKHLWVATALRGIEPPAPRVKRSRALPLLWAPLQLEIGTTKTDAAEHGTESALQFER